MKKAVLLSLMIILCLLTSCQKVQFTSFEPEEFVNNYFGMSKKEYFQKTNLSEDDFSITQMNNNGITQQLYTSNDFKLVYDAKPYQIDITFNDEILQEVMYTYYYTKENLVEGIEFAAEIIDGFNSNYQYAYGYGAYEGVDNEGTFSSLIDSSESLTELLVDPADSLYFQKPDIWIIDDSIELYTQWRVMEDEATFIIGLGPALN